METINTELLISLVEERPVLWDKTSDSYKEKQLKNSAWREICVLLNEGFEGMEEKQRQEFGKLVLKKWTHTRDSWMKAMKKQKDQKTSGSSAKYSKLYVFNEQMSFLKKIVNLSVAHDSADSDANVSIDVNGEEGAAVNDNDEGKRESPPQSMRKSSSSEQRKRKFPMRNEVDATMMKFIEHQMNVPKEQENCHTAFFKSISPSLSVLTDDQTLEFQAGVITLLQNIKRKAPTLINFPLYQQHRRDHFNYQEWQNNASYLPQEVRNTTTPPSSTVTSVNPETVLSPQQLPVSPASAVSQYSSSSNFSQL